MIGKAVCLIVVLVIAAHAAEIDSDLTDHLEVGPASVALAEVSSRVSLRDTYDAYSLDDERDERYRDYDEDAAEEKRRRRRRARKRRAMRRAMRQAERELLEPKPPGAVDPVFPTNGTTTNGTASNSTSPTGASNSTGPSNSTRSSTGGPRGRMSRKMRKLHKSVEDLEMEARMHRAEARVHEANARVYSEDIKHERLLAKMKAKDNAITDAVHQANQAIGSIQGELESEDIKEDQHFWDSYYGRPTVAQPGAPVDPASNAKRDVIPKKEKVEDLGLPLFKASHIASYDEAYAHVKKIKKLDDMLQEDGDNYINFIRQFN